MVANPDELRPLLPSVASHPTRRAFISLLPGALAQVA
jgi:hypothetical protein